MSDTLTEEQANWVRDTFGFDVSASPLAPGDAAPGGPPAAVNPAVEGPKTAMTGRYAVTFNAESGAAWKSTELSAVSGAFSAIPAADRDALKGVEVDRVPSVGHDPLSADAYETQTDTTTDPATQTRKIMVTDGTFVDTANGGTPFPPAEQTRKIVHEVGHVVAKKSQLDADFAAAKAVVDSNKAAAALKNAQDELKPVNEALRAANDEHDKLEETRPTSSAGRKENAAALQALTAKIAAAEAAAEPFRDRQKAAWDQLDAAKAALQAANSAAAATRVPPATVAAGQTDLEASGTAADSTTPAAATIAMNTQAQKDSEAYRRASAAVDTSLKSYASDIKAGKVGANTGQTSADAMDRIRDAAIDTRNQARKNLHHMSAKNPALKGFAPVDQAQDTYYQKMKTQARLPNRPPKIQAFVDLVTHQNITPFTPYATGNWPFKPEEFFAEAYALWRTDPARLKTIANPLFDWFESGAYR